MKINLYINNTRTGNNPAELFKHIMKSRISIDFKGLDDQTKSFEPVIRINVEDSDDVRDGLVKAFIEKLDYRSNWLRADFDQYTTDGKVRQAVTITAISPDELESTIETMKSRLVIPESTIYLNTIENIK